MYVRVQNPTEFIRSLNCEPGCVPDTGVKMMNTTDVVYTFIMPAI